MKPRPRGTLFWDESRGRGYVEMLLLHPKNGIFMSVIPIFCLKISNFCPKYAYLTSKFSSVVSEYLCYLTIPICCPKLLIVCLNRPIFCLNVLYLPKKLAYSWVQWTYKGPDTHTFVIYTLYVRSNAPILRGIRGPINVSNTTVNQDSEGP